MTMRSSNNPLGSFTEGTDKRIGDAFPIIEAVYKRLAELTYLSENLHLIQPSQIEFRNNVEEKTVEWRYVGQEDWFVMLPLLGALNTTFVVPIAASDEISPLTVGTKKVVFRLPLGMQLMSVRASVTDAPTGGPITVGIKLDGLNLLNPKITIEAGEVSSFTADIQPGLISTVIGDDSEIIIDIEAVGPTLAGTGLKVYLIGKALAP